VSVALVAPARTEPLPVGPSTSGTPARRQRYDRPVYPDAGVTEKDAGCSRQATARVTGCSAIQGLLVSE
jgi:hypothetical protein